MQSEGYNFLLRLRRLITQDQGQDLIEYALVVALIAFGATAGIKNVATGIHTAFGNISSQLSTNVT